MAFRRLPGSREPNQTGPGGRPAGARPQAVAPTLFDGETGGLATPPRRAEIVEPQKPSMIFGARFLLAVAVLLQIGFAILMAPRLIHALDALTLSLRPAQIVPLAAIGALEVALLVWAAWNRSWGGAVTVCLLAVAWWGYFAAQIL